MCLETDKKTCLLLGVVATYLTILALAALDPELARHFVDAVVPGARLLVVPAAP